MLPATRERKPPTEPPAPHADDHLRCQWTAYGERCRYAGTISPMTTGMGPWYCHGHFFCSDAAHGQRIVEESRSTVIDENHSAEATVARSRRAFLEVINGGRD